MIRNNLRDKAKLIEENSSSYINNLNAPADKDPQRNVNIQSASIYNNADQTSTNGNFELMSSKSFVSTGGQHLNQYTATVKEEDQEIEETEDELKVAQYENRNKIRRLNGTKTLNAADRTKKGRIIDNDNIDSMQEDQKVH